MQGIEDADSMSHLYRICLPRLEGFELLSCAHTCQAKEVRLAGDKGCPVTNVK